MKLGKVTSNEPTDRLAVSIKVSASNMLKAYKEHYKTTYGEEITMNQLVETMLVDYMKDDKDFVKAQSGKPAKAPATQAAPAATAKEKEKAEAA